MSNSKISLDFFSDGLILQQIVSLDPLENIWPSRHFLNSHLPSATGHAHFLLSRTLKMAVTLLLKHVQIPITTSK